jgi:acyl transferase domain-containing protein
MAPPDTTTGLEIAIIGMAGRFPSAPSVGEFWQRLVDGVECISVFSEEQLLQAGVNAAALADAQYVPAAGVVDDVDRFDAAFFGYSPREAALIDPQQRLFLETAWTALEHAGYAPGTFRAPTGVFGGAGLSDYFHKHVIPALGGVFDYPATVANDKDFLTTRVSYKLNLEGPSVVVQTACSTSLVAVHLACQSLLAGECDMALAGGVTLRLPQHAGYHYQEGGITSPDGHCRAFSAGARGCVPGSGGAVVVLKRLADALADRDTIHAVIKGTAINNDGARKIGYTAPRVEGQARVIRAALALAGVSADTIGYLEAHGTGTVLGDPIEIEAATQAYRQDTAATGYCAIGAVKTNVGHLDAAAGVTGLIKAALAVKKGVVPATLHFTQPNPRIDFDHSPFTVNHTRRDWAPETNPRRAGVSSFGIGGTNAHVVLEEPPSLSASRSRSPELLVLSAKTEGALEQATANLLHHLREHPDINLSDVGYTLRHGRAAFRHRRAVVCHSVRDAVERLADTARTRTATAASDNGGVVFMFPGQGSQYAGMARELYTTEPEFRLHVDQAADLLIPLVGFNLRDAIRAADHDQRMADILRDTRVAQPAIFTVAYATARLLLSWGVTPSALIGHSIGEYVAACVAGVFSVEDALWLVAERGRLMSGVGPGSMLAVPLSADEISPDLPADVVVAATNAPRLSVVSGPEKAVNAFRESLQRRGLEARPLHTSHAFHSPMMEPVLEAFVATFDRVRLHEPQVPLVSNVTGTWIRAAQATDPRYWAQHLRGTVRFSEGLQTVLASHPAVLLEVGPGQTLTALAARHAQPTRSIFALPTTRRAELSDPAASTVLRETLGRLWTSGIDVDWSRVDMGTDARRIPLPTYPFQRERHWIEAVALERAAMPTGRVQRAELADWFSVPTWQRMPKSVVARTEESDAWVVFADTCGVAAAVATRLRTMGRRVFMVSAGQTFTRLDEDRFEIAPGAPEDYQRLCSALSDVASGPLRIMHCWNVTRDDEARRGVEHLSAGSERGFYSLLWLAQALGGQAWVTNCHMTVVSTGIHEVVGGEVLFPEKALVLGPCRVIPLEYDSFECTHIDIALTVGDPVAAHVIEQVIETIEERPTAPVAIRGANRWRQTIEPMRLGPALPPALLKTNGVYVITGGLGGVGLAVAEYLAKTVKARLVLIGRTGLPPGGPQLGLAGAARLDAADAIATLSRNERQIVATVPLSPMSSFDGLRETLEQLSTALVLRHLTDAGVYGGPSGSLVDRTEVARQCGVVPRFHRLFTRMLDMLVEDGYAVTAGASIRFTERVRPRFAELLVEARARYPQMTALFVLFDNCAQHYREALSGQIPAISLLFGDNERDVFQRAVDTIREHSYVPLCEALVKTIVAELVSQPRQGPLRLVEIGGGEGRLTQVLSPMFEGKNVDYHFTDIGRSFVLNAQREAARRGHAFMKFGVLDISRAPSAQGFAPGSVDVVLAFNVLHATTSVAESLAHASELLAPGGLLVLQESVQPSRWVDLIWGLTDGWFAFTDESVRPSSPLLTLEGWSQALNRAGFTEVVAYPRDAPVRDGADTGVVVARKPAAGLISATPTEHDSQSPDEIRAAVVRSLEAYGAEVTVVAADVADHDAMRHLVDRTLDRYGRIDGVIHAALVLNDGAMQRKTPDAVERVFAPKVTGTLVLEEVFKGCELDFLVVFSSLVSFLGGAGQVDYCAASNFQDAWVQTVPPATARNAIAINWGAWRKVGRAFRGAVERGESPESALPDGMTPAEGVEAFLRGLAARQPQILISPQHLEVAAAPQRATRFSAGAVETSAATVLVTGAQAESSAAEDGRVPHTEVERLIAALWEEVLGVERVALDDNFFDLGGDSMISLQFIAKAKKAGLRFTNHQVFEHQTVAELAVVASRAEDQAGTRVTSS